MKNAWCCKKIFIRHDQSLVENLFVLVESTFSLCSWKFVFRISTDSAKSPFITYDMIIPVESLNEHVFLGGVFCLF